MSIMFGGMRQLAFVVRDLPSTLKYWTETLGVGPFHVMSGVEVADYTYRGAAMAGPRLDVGLSWSGAFQIEIIQQTNEVPSAYLDFLKSGREGMHHVCSWYDSAQTYEAAIARAANSGASIVHQGALGSAALGTTARFSYFATNKVPGGFYFEVAEGLVPALQPFMTMIEESARHWDGRDPIRHLS
jgi:catechol 2,3-dioxygenase-like lactoylglutathione lyase family enzyme